MKTIAIIAEYNPFHNGHLKQIEYVKKELKADRIVVVMSGDFTQRGEPAIINKFDRAKHAIIAGADIVIEMPTVFAMSNAETFANGAIKIIDSLGIVNGICFGTESGEKQEYINLATELTNESKDFKKALREKLQGGISLAKAKFEALISLGKTNLNEALMQSPNNILGLEYTKAIKKQNSPLEIYPFIREGNHNDSILKKGVTSASSIRNALKLGIKRPLKKCLPKFVYRDIKDYPIAFNNMIMTSILTTSLKEFSEISDCTEGLENRIKTLSKKHSNLDALISDISTKRYTQARIRRILTASMLKIKQSFVDDCLNSPLYIKILAIDSNKKDILADINVISNVPVLTRKSDGIMLKNVAYKCFETDELANDLYNLATNENQNNNSMIIV